MATAPKSRWLDSTEETPEAAAQRKREKEERKRLKEEKLRKAELSHPTQPQSNDSAPEVNGESERPAKRLRLDEDIDPRQELEENENGRLLHFPTRGFGACREVELYELLNSIEEGSYGFVSRARQKATGEIVALKKLKMEHTYDGFPVTGLREIQTLMASRHANIVTLREVVMGASLKE